MSKPIRTFVAIQLSSEIRQSAIELQHALAKSDASVKWVEPDNIHLTLQFLGNVPDQEIADVCRVVQRAADSAVPFEMTVEMAGAFPSALRPRTVWLAVSVGSEELVALHKSLEDGLVPLGYRREKRRFHPHMTIGRVRGRPDQLGESLVAKHDWAAGSMVVDEIVVMTSELKSKGPHYNVMGRARLNGEA